MEFIKFFKNVKIQKQLFSTLLVIFSVPVLFIGSFLVRNAKQNMTRQYNEQVRLENSRVKAILFNLTTNIYNVSENFASDSELISLLSRRYTDDADLRQHFDQYKLISRTLSQQTSIYSIKVYTNNESITKHSHFTYCNPEIRREDWYHTLSENEGILWKTLSREEHGYTLHTLTMYRKIPLPEAGDFGVLEIAVSNNYLKNVLDNKSILSIACVNQETAFYNTSVSSEIDMKSLIEYERPYNQADGKFTINNQEYIGATATLQPYRSNDYIYIFSFSKNAITYINKLTLDYLLILLLALFIPCFLLYLYTKYFSARINLLRSAMHQVSQGDYNIIHSFKGNDELSETFDDLLVMVQKIENKEALIYQNKLREQELINKQQQLENKQQQMEFKILTSQINPHFLYNTLETIRMKAFNEDNLEVATAIKLLGRYLHYALESIGTTSTTLSNELHYIEIYLKIQKLRFKERINYEIIVEPDLDLTEYHILPFLFQPIIENAILHGLEGMESRGLIQIHIFTLPDEFLYITIKDNGEGMDPEKLNALRRTICLKDEGKTRSIGLYNINQRIRLCYGSEYGMEIESTTGEGTFVSLKLPLDK